MASFVATVKKRLDQVEKDIANLEAKIADKKALLDKYQELLALEGGAKPRKKAAAKKTAAKKGKRGRPPKKGKGKVGRPPKKTKGKVGRPPKKTKGKVGRPPKKTKGKVGRPPKKTKAKSKAKAAGKGGRDGQLPKLIIEALGKAKEPMRAKDLLDIVTKKGWKTASSEPQLLVYKTLFRLEKEGRVAKAGRGKFIAGKGKK